MNPPAPLPSTTHSPAGVAPTRLDPSAPRPLHRQVADALRQDVLAGKLRPGQRLASSRALADQLGVSRNTVVHAFDQLTAEGYLVGVRGSGTFVSRDLPAAPAGAPGSRVPRAALSASDLPISRAGHDLIALADGQRSTWLRPFQSGIAALDALPLALYRRVAAAAFAELDLGDLGYGDPRGFPPLRRALAELLWSSRGVSCEPDQIFIVGGSQHALDLAARVLLDPGDRAWIEDPGYLGTRAALASSGAELVPVPLDADGLIVQHGRRQAPDARLACVTPSHQYPLGTVMGVGRRLELLEWARGARAWILEDDYDSEFRYAGRPLPALKSLDGSERVLYVGTFSKVLFPALRLGYLVVPRSLVGAFLGARFCSGRQAPIADQAAITRFLGEGHLARHLRRMRGLYRQRQHCLVQAVAETLAGRLEVAPSDVGMHLVGWLPDGIDDRSVARRAELRGLRAEPLSRYVLQHALRPGLLLGYTAFDTTAIRRGVAELGAAIDG